MFKHLFISIIFGALIGGSTALYGYGLERIQNFHKDTQLLYPLALIAVFGIIYFVKRNTLYFPTSVSQVIDSDEIVEKHWSPFSYFWNLVASWMSHAAGASLGREGTVLVLASSLAQLCRLQWNYYKPVVISAAFACVVGQPLIALVFILEMFTSSVDQKVFSVIMAWVGYLVLQSFHFTPLFSPMIVDLSAGFWDKMLVVLMIGLSTGFLTNLFKRGYHDLSPVVKKNKWAAVGLVLILSGLFILPAMKIYHSYSMGTYEEVLKGQGSIQFILLKSLFTMLFVSLGFIGGDFVPSIVIGGAIGVVTAEFYHVNFTFGLAMGLMAFFTGLTRLKWTSFWLIFLLAGFNVALWSYVCLSITRQLSGGKSLYRKELELI